MLRRWQGIYIVTYTRYSEYPVDSLFVWNGYVNHNKQQNNLIYRWTYPYSYISCIGGNGNTLISSQWQQKSRILFRGNTMVSIFDRTKTDAEQGLCRFDRTSVTNHMSKVWRILMWQNWIKSKTGTFDLISQHKESSNFWLLKPQRSYPATVGGLWDPEIIESPLHHFSLIHLCDPCFFT